MPQAVLHATFRKNVAVGPRTRIVLTVEAPWRNMGEFKLREADDVNSNHAAFAILKNFLVSQDYFEQEDR